MIKRFIPFLLILVITMTGCSSLGVKQRGNEIHDIITLINDGESGKLISISSIPFLIDGEIILVQSDIDLLWNGFAKSGLTINNPLVENVEPVNEQTYTQFSKAMDVQVFFKKYVPKKAVCVTVMSEDGVYYFVTGREKEGFVTIHGMKGPVQ